MTLPSLNSGNVLERGAGNRSGMADNLRNLSYGELFFAASPISPDRLSRFAGGLAAEPSGGRIAAA